MLESQTSHDDEDSDSPSPGKRKKRGNNDQLREEREEKLLITGRKDWRKEEYDMTLPCTFYTCQHCPHGSKL